jgi:hypothetical protein
MDLDAESRLLRGGVSARRPGPARKCSVRVSVPSSVDPLFKVAKTVFPSVRRHDWKNSRTTERIFVEEFYENLFSHCLITFQSDKFKEPLYTNTFQSDKSKEPLYTNTFQSDKFKEPLYTNIHVRFCVHLTEYLLERKMF